MPRLPSTLQPLWPVLKRAHVASTRQLGTVTRFAADKWEYDRAIPVIGTNSVRETVALNPDSAVLHVGGPEEFLRRTVPIGRPAHHWVFERRANYDIPERFVLEIQKGTIVGDYAAHITPGGTLDYETSTYFGVTGWREHPIYLRTRLPEAEHFGGSLLSLATRGSSANYYHFLLDVLPRWGVFREAMPSTRVDAYFVNRRSGYQRQLLSLIGLDDIVTIEPQKNTAITADTLYVPCIPNPDLMAPQWTTDWLKTNLPAKDSASRPKRLYVTRGSAKNTRRLTNEAELLDKLIPMGFEVFDPGANSVQDQIDTFTAAEVIVAPHGAALSNLVFCSPGVRVLELFAPRYVNPCYWTIADNVPDSTYRYLVCGEDPRPAGSPMDGVLTDIVADVPAVLAELDALLT